MRFYSIFMVIVVIFTNHSNVCLGSSQINDTSVKMDQLKTATIPKDLYDILKNLLQRELNGQQTEEQTGTSVKMDQLKTATIPKDLYDILKNLLQRELNGQQTEEQSIKIAVLEQRTMLLEIQKELATLTDTCRVASTGISSTLSPNMKVPDPQGDTGLVNDLRLLNKSMEHLQQETQALQQHNTNLTEEIKNLKLENQALIQNDRSFKQNIANLKQQNAAFRQDHQNITEILDSLILKEESNRRQVDELMANISGTKGSLPRIGFTVRLGGGDKTVSGIMVFKSIIANYGAGYNQTTGKFTCNKSGLYMINLSILSYTPYAQAYIMKNSASLVFTYTSGGGSKSNPESGSVNAVVELVVGDQIWVKSNGSYRYSFQSYFSGALISA